MQDIGLLPIINRIAEASLAAHRTRKGATAIREQFVEAIEPMVEELVLIGVERAIIAVDDCAKALRRNVRKGSDRPNQRLREIYATGRSVRGLPANEQRPEGTTEREVYVAVPFDP